MSDNFFENRILNELLKLRDSFDSLWKLSASNSPEFSVQRLLVSEIRTYQTHNKILTSYPKGYCLPITKILFKAMNSDGFFEQYPDLSAIREHIKSGDARVIWGACRGRYFQTALQIGEWYVDVANDTVDVNKPKVEIHRMDSPECPFAFINDLKTYLSIKEYYHDVLIYRNTTFPAFSDEFPIISVSNSGGNLTIESDIYITKLRNLDPAFSSTLQSYPELPEELVGWINQQPELSPYTLPLIENQSNLNSKSHKMQLRLVVTAINSFIEKRGS